MFTHPRHRYVPRPELPENARVQGAPGALLAAGGGVMVKRWLIDAKGTITENPDCPDTPEFHEYHARVLEREAEARPHDPGFQATLREWAANTRRRGAAIKRTPVQGDLFGEVAGKEPAP